MKIYIVWYDNGEFGEKNIVIDSAWIDYEEAKKRENFLYGMYADVAEVDLDNMEMKRSDRRFVPSDIYTFKSSKQ